VSTTITPAQITLGAYAQLVLRRWKALVAGLLVGVLAAVGLYAIAPREYTARTAVLVLPTVSDGTQIAGSRTTTVLNLDTEAQILRSSLVATLAADILGSDEDPLDLVRQVKVAVPPNTSVLEVSFTAPTPDGARRGTIAFAQAYLDNRAASAQAVVEAGTAEVAVAISALDVRLADLAARLVLLPIESPDRVFLEGERSLVLQSKGRLQEQLDALVGGAVTGGEVLTQPRVPRNASAPNERLYLVGGMLAGLLVGLGLALLAERRNRRLWRADEVTDFHGLPVVAELDLRDAPGGRLDATASTAAALSHLANTIRARSDLSRSTTSVVGASIGDAPGWVSANLARTLARAGDRVGLVSAAPEPAAATAALGVAPRAGLTHVLTGAERIDKALVDVEGSLTLIGVGADGHVEPEWLSSSRMYELVGEIEERNRFVVLDSSAVPVSGDAQAMAFLAHAAIIVAELGVTSPDELTAAARAIAAVSTPLVGVVVVRRRTSRRWERRRTAESAPESTQRVVAAASPAAVPTAADPDRSEEPPRPAAGKPDSTGWPTGAPAQVDGPHAQPPSERRAPKSSAARR